MKTKPRAATYLAAVLMSGLMASGAFSQRAPTDTNTLETIANRALQTFLRVSYRGNGRPLSASGLSSWLTQNKIGLSQLPADIAGDLRRGKVEGLLIPDVSNPVVPGTTGEVVIVRSKCLLTEEGCSRRGVLIQPPYFFGKGADEEEWCENCTGCEGAKNPPACDIYDICVCTQRPKSSGCRACPKCPGC